MYPPIVYQRGATLCRVAHLPKARDIEGCTIPKGTAIIVPLQRAGLPVELGRVAIWKRIKGEGQDAREYPSDPCPKVAAALLEAVGQWEGVPTLLGISETPILRQDDHIHTSAGYDPATQLYIEGLFPEFQLNDRVTQDEAQRAARYLLRPFDEFPFVDREQGLAVVLAYLLTLALRLQLPTAPLFCISSTTPGTGKGLLVEVANLLVRGRDVALTSAVQGNGAEEETRKRITALLLQGVSSISLDNWTRPIGGDAMNALLTASEWTDRILGRSETVTLPARVTLAATGNNLVVRGDMTRRSLIIQLDAGVERPELRVFEKKNLRGFVLETRRFLLAAVYTILKGYQQAGRPGADEGLLGRFEEWSAAVAAPIRWLGMADPVTSQERLREGDPDLERLELLLEAWFDLKGDEWVTVAELVQAVAGTNHFLTASGEKGAAARLHEALVEIANDGRGNINRRTVGWYLRHFEGRIAGGLRLEKKPRQGKSNASQQYRVMRLEDTVSNPGQIALGDVP
jgi:hypothetical protein